MPFASSNSSRIRRSGTFCAISAVFVIVSVSSQAAEQSFEGIVDATETRGGTSTQTLYTTTGNELRIENPDKSKPESINIFDLAAKKLTIVYPHNSSFVVVDLTTKQAPVAGVADPGWGCRACQCRRDRDRRSRRQSDRRFLPRLDFQRRRRCLPCRHGLTTL